MPILYHSDSSNCSMEQAVEPKDDKVNSFNFLCIDFCRFYVDFRIKFLEVLRICCFT